MTIRKRIRVSIYAIVISYLVWGTYTFLESKQDVVVSAVAQSKHYDTGKYGNVSYFVIYKIEENKGTLTRYYYQSDWNNIQVGHRITESIPRSDLLKESNPIKSIISFFAFLISAVIVVFGTLFLGIYVWCNYLLDKKVE